MSMNREHALELLTLLAVIAIVQVPINDPIRAKHSSASPPAAEAEPNGTMADPTIAPYRLDPLALLQASVPTGWRVSLSSSVRAPSTAVREEESTGIGMLTC